MNDVSVTQCDEPLHCRQAQVTIIRVNKLTRTGGTLRLRFVFVRQYLQLQLLGGAINYLLRPSTIHYLNRIREIPSCSESNAYGEFLAFVISTPCDRL